MARSFIVPGECMVSVKGGAHMSGGPIGQLSQLGLAEDSITVSPVWRHYDLRADDFGPDVPPEVLWNLAAVEIEMTLIHYDFLVLDYCLSESMAGVNAGVYAGGALTGAGAPLGNGFPALSSGNHYISLNLSAQQSKFPWHFPTAYLLAPPLMLPQGTTISKPRLRWRAIPYRPLFNPNTRGSSGAVQIGGQFFYINELMSSGAVLWDHVLDKSG